ncbi:helix-turn-helix domain-containing protein [Rhizorhabdus histidinilytica]|jgi:DNA-binding transcriptional regulator YdaS (Cro superfamily)|uniref:XRE family transcriptional regulator n=1 Tax=Rhizorhabdus histidinilytica TaxID=439228 RepID=A0A1T5BWS7_9SPHN|nr:helix-turn-helix transcriptional regulator [Rhizorhabdus histidinilytica]SKB51808.1 hypothetical protein SAMN06295920_103357 [Rhizorhabdus histidinilytica]
MHKLKAYLTDQRISYSEFAQMIGVANAGVVQKYIDGSRTPRPTIMRNIVRVTEGHLQPNDFFELGAADNPTDQAQAA